MNPISFRRPGREPGSPHSSRRRRHFTVSIVAFWLCAVFLALVLQLTAVVQLPLKGLVVSAGLITAAYLGLEQGANALASGKLPAGMGMVPPTRQYLAIVIVWLVLMVLGLVTQGMAVAGITVPVVELVSFAGLTSAAYVAGNKANRLATHAGPRPEAAAEPEAGGPVA